MHSSLTSTSIFLSSQAIALLSPLFLGLFLSLLLHLNPLFHPLYTRWIHLSALLLSSHLKPSLPFLLSSYVHVSHSCPILILSSSPLLTFISLLDLSFPLISSRISPSSSLLTYIPLTLVPSFLFPLFTLSLPSGRLLLSSFPPYHTQAQRREKESRGGELFFLLLVSLLSSPSFCAARPSLPSFSWGCQLVCGGGCVFGCAAGPENRLSLGG